MSEYVRLAGSTERTDDSQDALMVALLGLAGEAGSVVTEAKKWLRSGGVHQGLRERTSEELGDLLWYLAAVIRHLDLDLGEVAAANLLKVGDVWSERLPPMPSYDADRPDNQRFPRRMRVRFVQDLHASPPVVRVVPLDALAERMQELERDFVGDPLNDNSIWVMQKGADNLPAPGQIRTFLAPATNPVDLEISPGGELFYVDFDGGTIRRIQYVEGNQPPVARATANPTSGPVPLTVNFDGSASSDPEGETITQAWDLDGDGAYDDSTEVKPTYTYTESGNYTVTLKVSDSRGATDLSDPITITVGNTPPAATILSPPATLTWKVGDVINFEGSASDQQDGALVSSALTCDLILHHCPSNCHAHPLQSFPGVAAGLFTEPDHDHPSHLELRLTATDSDGLKDTETVLLYPRRPN